MFRTSALFSPSTTIHARWSPSWQPKSAFVRKWEPTSSRSFDARAQATASDSCATSIKNLCMNRLPTWVSVRYGERDRDQTLLLAPHRPAYPFLPDSSHGTALGERRHAQGAVPSLRSGATTALLLAGCGAAGIGRAAVVRVPEDFPVIQAAIDAAQGGDTVLISRGTYAGGLVISGKSLTLASRYIETGDTNDIVLTTLSGGNPILTIQVSAGPATTVRGLTFLNGGYHIENYARRVSILDDHFVGGSNDQMSFEGAGGLVRGCRFEHAGDDGIDVDNASDPTIENNTILSPGDDGIELRLHPYTGPTLQIAFRDNVISGCKEDGI